MWVWEIAVMGSETARFLTQMGQLKFDQPKRRFLFLRLRLPDLFEDSGRTAAISKVEAGTTETAKANKSLGSFALA